VENRKIESKAKLDRVASMEVLTSGLSLTVVLESTISSLCENIALG
jgi:hypothetical protein